VWQSLRLPEASGQRHSRVISAFIPQNVPTANLGGLFQLCRDRTERLKFTKANPRQDGSTPPVDLAIPLFGYQNHVSIDRRFGFIRRWAATDAAAYEGRRLRQGLLNKSNTASGVWADTAYRSGRHPMPPHHRGNQLTWRVARLDDPKRLFRRPAPRGAVPVVTSILIVV
jgi:hypothetical protein